MLGTLKKLLIMVVSVFLACAVIALLVQAFAPEGNGVVPTLITAIVCVLLGGVSTLFLTGHTLRDLYGGGTRSASAQILRQILGIDESIQIIDNGRTVVPPNGKLSLPGPRLVIIRESIVTFYQGSRRTRIEGPGFVHTKLWEYAQNAQDLRPRERTWPFPDVLSKNDLPLQCELRVSFGPMVPPEVLRGARSLTPPDMRPLQRLDLHRPDIEATVKSVLEAEIRRKASELTTDDIKSETKLEEIDDHLVAQANRRLSLWGIYAYSVVVTKLCPCQDLVHAYACAQAAASMDAKTAEAISSLYKTGAMLPANDLALEALRRLLLGLFGDRRQGDWSATAAGPSRQIVAAPPSSLPPPKP